MHTEILIAFRGYVIRPSRVTELIFLVRMELV